MLLRCVCVVLLGLTAINLRAAQVQVKFFSEYLTVDYDPGLLNTRSTGIRELPPYLMARYREYEERNYAPLLQSLQNHRAALDLNDWLYFDLMQRAVAAAYARAADIDRRAVVWFLLCQSGFDARLTYRGRRVWINAYTDEALFEVGMIEDGPKKLVNLSSLLRKDDGGALLYILNFVPNPGGRSFSFDLDRLPLLEPRYEERTYRFGTPQARHQLRVRTDQTVVDLMRRYPFIDEEKYLEVPLSAALYESLVPKLREKMHGLTERERVELLAAFTRMGFNYKTDEEYFGRSRPMIADEVLSYPYSDCEDRSALFYALAKELIGAPMVVLAYPDHVTVGVATDAVLGDAVEIDGRAYYICDPTGPSNSAAVGKFPKGYAKRRFEVLSRYK